MSLALCNVSPISKRIKYMPPSTLLLFFIYFKLFRNEFTIK